MNLSRSIAATCLVVSVLAACGSEQGAAEGEGSAAADTRGARCPSIDPATIALAMVDAAVIYESVDDMAQETVLIGRVVAERDGVVPYAGDYHDSSDELRRVVTIDVEQNLTGDKTLKRFTVQTMGWTTSGGRRKPLSIDGTPWLEVGTDVLVAVKLHDDRYGFAGQNGVQAFCRDKVLPVPGTSGGVSDLLVGMSKSEVIRRFEQADAVRP